MHAYRGWDVPMPAHDHIIVAMDYLYTKSGYPLKVLNGDIFNSRGRQVAKLRGDRAFGPDGKYVGSVISGRLVYRSTHASRIGTPYAPKMQSPFSRARRVGSAILGEEPPIPH